MIGIVVSEADRASEHVGEQLLDLRDWERRADDRPAAEGGGTYYRTGGFELRTFADLHLHLERPDEAFEDPALLAFVSRHAGETGPLLSTHFTGNFGPAEYGGDPGAFARACPEAQKAVLAALTEHAPEGYEVGIECTHHGPTAVGVPSMFVELGSGEAEWNDPDGARAVARAVLDIEGVGADRPLDAGGADEPQTGGGKDPDGSGATGTRHVLGAGGGHYAPRFERIVRETPWAVGHVAADWGLEAMGDPAENRAVLERAVAASQAGYAVVAGEHPGLRSVLADLGCRPVSETWVREVGAAPPELVERLEAALTPVEEGLRVGRPAREAGADRDGDGGSGSGSGTGSAGDGDGGGGDGGDPEAGFAVVDLPEELVGAAAGVDREAARAALAERALAFETEEGGAVPAGRAALPAGTGRGAVVDALVEVLGQGYEAVERDGNAVVLRETAFDPAAARELGVPEGPAFGRLAEGEAVEVDGETVEPDEVRTERVRRVSLK